VAYSGLEIAVRSWDEYEAALRTLCGGSIFGNVVFRGLSNHTYDMRPSFPRHLRWDPTEFRNVAYAKESEAFQQFKREARHFIDPSIYAELRDANNPLQWLTLMQHHGGPTRLLDWTTSPYVALYFASESHPDSDGTVVVWQREMTRTIQEERYGQAFKDFTTAAGGTDADVTTSVLFDSDRDDIPDMITGLSTNITTRRLSSQSGLFSMTTTPYRDHGEVIEEIVDESENDRIYGKILVKAESKSHLVPRLRRSNLHGFSLFPDLEGLGKLCREGILWTENPYDS
jgi:hypothetical protein